jgi:hypothetical protein
MVILRWILGIVSLLLGSGMVGAFLLYLGNGDDEWLKLTRKLRHWVYLVLLFWVNFEIWRRVLLIIIHWNG